MSWKVHYGGGRKFSVILIVKNFIFAYLYLMNHHCYTLNPSLTVCQSLCLTLPLMHNNNSSEGAVRIKTTSAALVSANYTDSTIILSGE